MSNPVSQRPVVGMYAFRSANPRRLASFWAEVMELPVSKNSTDELVMLDFDHEIAPVTWLFQLDTSVSSASARRAHSRRSALREGSFVDHFAAPEPGDPRIFRRPPKAGLAP